MDKQQARTHQDFWIGVGVEVVAIGVQLLIGGVFLAWLCVFLGIVLLLRGLKPSIFAKEIEAEIISGKPARQEVSPRAWIICVVLVAVLSISASWIHGELRPPPLLPPRIQDIEQFAAGVVMAIFGQPPGGTDQRSDDQIITGTAFYVHTDGYAVTCVDALIELQRTKHNNVGVILSLPVHAGLLIEGAGAVRVGALLGRSNQAEAVLIQVKGPLKKPLQKQTPRAIARRGEESVVAHSWIVELRQSLPNTGDRLYVYGVERGSLPSYSLYETSLVRSGIEENSGIRLYARMAIYKRHYCGAPVFDENKAVVGMVVKQVDGEVVIMPARYIVSLMREDGLR